MGMNAFLGIPGVKGSAKQQHVLGKIIVHGVTAQVLAELNWKTGRPEKEKSKHTPFMIIKPIDVSSPALHVALQNGSVWDVVELEFWRMPPVGGKEEKYFKIGMFNAQVMSIKTMMPNNRLQENSLIPEQEEVTFCFEGIGYRFETSGGMQSESNDTKKLDAKFEIPAEAKAKEIALALGKDAGKAFAGEVFSLLQGDEEKPK